MNSENEKAWCATGVDSNRNAINGDWADCNPGCPGTGTQTQIPSRSSPTGKTFKPIFMPNETHFYNTVHFYSCF